MSLYERVGGDEYFHALAGIFYDGIDGDPVLRTWARGKANLAELLIQYWGGPHDYSARRGHPRLRMRHFPLRSVAGNARRGFIA